MKQPHGYRAQARALIGLAAFLAFALSVTLYFSGDETAGIYVAIWVPSILALKAFLVPRQGEARPSGSPAPDHRVYRLAPRARPASSN